MNANDAIILFNKLECRIDSLKSRLKEMEEQKQKMAEIIVNNINFGDKIVNWSDKTEVCIPTKYGMITADEDAELEQYLDYQIGDFVSNIDYFVDKIHMPLSPEEEALFKIEDEKDILRAVQKKKV